MRQRVTSFQEFGRLQRSKGENDLNGMKQLGFCFTTNIKYNEYAVNSVNDTRNIIIVYSETKRK